MKVIIASTSDVKRMAFDASDIASHLREICVNYEYTDGLLECCVDFESYRYPQPFTASGGVFAAMQRISAIREREKDNNSHFGNDLVIVIAIESYITENAKDCVCIVVNYYVNGEKRELVSFSPAAYIASFPDKYLQHLAAIEKYQPGVLGFKTTIGEVIELEYGGGVSKNWHKLFNPFDRVEQIRETLNYVVDEVKKIVA